MTKNKLEKLFSKTLKASPEFWGIKLHNNPLAHQNTPADYIISLEAASGDGKLFLVECKQVTCKMGKGRLAHKRLKQMHDMLSFQNKFNFHNSYWCIAFYDGRWSKSDIYIIPVQVMYDAIIAHSMVSFNRTDMASIFSKYRTIGRVDLCVLSI